MEMKPKYNPNEVEQDVMTIGLNGYFEASEDDTKETYDSYPPPNVTGKLHLGHAWDTTLQEIIT